jgi:hypothetical protein
VTRPAKILPGRWRRSAAMTERAENRREPVMDKQAEAEQGEAVRLWRAREEVFWQAMQAERDASLGEPECTEPECGVWH